MCDGKRTNLPDTRGEQIFESNERSNGVVLVADGISTATAVTTRREATRVTLRSAVNVSLDLTGSDATEIPAFIATIAEAATATRK
jgi:hypothetical protein